ncbi:MAG: 3-isopropylmalate dehydratase large subunit [Gammaproteobacteria bacterium]|nr:3-isopropylmalate dehydratase large subunit [Gammaproteobacteria bacterium]
MSSNQPKTLYDKVWDAHCVQPETSDSPAILYIDLHLLHEVTSPQAFAELETRGLPVRSVKNCLATIDHSTPTTAPDADGNRDYVTPQAKKQVDTLLANCQKHGIECHAWDSPHRGIVHVIGPEIGATQPGKTIVCGDSHTSTHGAFGALAFGIGTTEVGHVLASQCLLQRKSKSMRITVDGELQDSVSAKDVILHIIASIGVNGGTGYVIEYAGSAIRAMDMEERMTVCNMSIECGARAGMIAPDETTVAYLKGRKHAPQGADWDAAVTTWKSLATDMDAVFDAEVQINASDIQPTITYGTHPGMAFAVNSVIPQSEDASDKSSLEYMRFAQGEQVLGKPIDLVFIGSCTNSRIRDLRVAAKIMSQKKVKVRTLVVAGSELIKQQAEAEGLHEIFLQAGAEWREPGCSMCLGMNGDIGKPGDLVVSTSNRNFIGRQGKDVRTILASPMVAATSAIQGKIADPREQECAA